jgi:hypothetical protein
VGVRRLGRRCLDRVTPPSIERLVDSLVRFPSTPNLGFRHRIDWFAAAHGGANEPVSGALVINPRIGPILLRIGINTGPVVIGTVGSDLRVQFTLTASGGKAGSPEGGTSYLYPRCIGLAMKAALVTPFLFHLPFHPSCSLGYGSSILSDRFDLTVIDLNAKVHSLNRPLLEKKLRSMDQAQVVSDELFLYPFYAEMEDRMDEAYGMVPWEEYPFVFITPPAWFPTVHTEAVLRLSRTIWATAH